MARILTAICILLTVITLYGFVFLPSVRISVHEDDAKRVTVMVTAPRPADARWVSVLMCSAEFLEDAGVRCLPEGWFASSKKPVEVCQPQCEFPFGRYVPRGTVQISAVVEDANFTVLATGQKVVMR